MDSKLLVISVCIFATFFGCSHSFLPTNTSYLGSDKDVYNSSLVQFGLVSGLSHIMLLMDEVSLHEFKYNITCQNTSDEFVITFGNLNPSTMDIKGPEVIILSCKDHFDVTNGENVITREIPSRNITLLASNVFSGIIQMDLYGVTIGRSALMVKVYQNGIKPDVTAADPENVAKPENDFISEITVIGDIENLRSVNQFSVIVIRTLRPVDHVFKIAIYVLLTFVNLSFGCKLDIDVVKKALRKPVAVSIGLGTQYLVMPMIGFGIAEIVAKNEPSVALGIFLAGCCPGGGASNIYSFLLDGDLSLSITMTLMSTIAAIALFPFWLYTLGQVFIDAASEGINVPFLNIFTTLLVLILPLFVGIFIQYKLPKVKEFLIRIVTIVTVIAIVFLLTVGIYSNLHIFKLFKPRIILAGCLLPYFGYILGGLIALLFRQKKKKIITIAIETGMQNSSIAMLILLTAFPPPDGEIAAVAPIASAVMTPLPLFVITIFYLAIKKCYPEKFKNSKDDDEEGEKKVNGAEKDVELPLTWKDMDRETDIL